MTFEGHFGDLLAVGTLCVQLTRDQLAIAKFLECVYLGVESLIRRKVYSAAFPLHEVCVSNYKQYSGSFHVLIRLSLSPKFGLRPKMIQKVKLFSLSDSLRPNSGLSDR